MACQTDMGLRDKPGKRPDFYHTCYCLSGLAVSQQSSGRVLGDRQTCELPPVDARLNVLTSKLDNALAFWRKLDAQ